METTNFRLMNKLSGSTALAALALALLLASPSLYAAKGYLQTGKGEIVRNSYKECWRTSQWRPELAIAECDAMAKEEPEMATAEPAAQPTPEPKMMSLTLNNETLFDFDKAVIKPEAKSKLDNFIKQLRSASVFEKFYVTGHADRIGSDAYNQDLSLRRANAVKDYLVANSNVIGSKVIVEGKGETDPIKACEGIRGDALIKCLAPNRRVEIIGHFQKKSDR